MKQLLIYQGAYSSWRHTLDNLMQPSPVTTLTYRPHGEFSTHPLPTLKSSSTIPAVFYPTCQVPSCLSQHWPPLFCLSIQHCPPLPTPVPNQLDVSAVPPQDVPFCTPSTIWTQFRRRSRNRKIIIINDLHQFVYRSIYSTLHRMHMKYF